MNCINLELVKNEIYDGKQCTASQMVFLLTVFFPLIA